VLFTEKHCICSHCNFEFRRILIPCHPYLSVMESRFSFSLLSQATLVNLPSIFEPTSVPLSGSKNRDFTVLRRASYPVLVAILAVASRTSSRYPEISDSIHTRVPLTNSSVRSSPRIQVIHTHPTQFECFVYKYWILQQAYVCHKYEQTSHWVVLCHLPYILSFYSFWFSNW